MIETLIVMSGVVTAGKVNFATSARPIPAVSTATATVPRGSASARPTGEESYAIKVIISVNSTNIVIVYC